ncbi:hypothetical protein [Nocardioides campestrisoli]|uniref:hypothetical protein n=1 Tax=Nocardioides campestrisoli TaxID=2736757 RepID=UPI0015E6F15B|nr:hypothetical protein [Nocardioides campestrisoli]
MALRYDWFLAPDDAAAAAALTPGATSYRTLADTRVDPVAQGGTLEALLTGRSSEQIAGDPRWGAQLATRDAGDRMVLTITDALVDALATADDERLAEVAGPWAMTEEFRGEVSPETLRVQLRLLAALARAARAAGGSLYCRVQR